MNKYLILVLILFVVSVARATEFLDIGKTYHLSIERSGRITYILNVPKESNLRIAITNATSNLDWTLVDSLDNSLYRFYCDFSEESEELFNQEVCDVLLKSGSYFLTVDEMDDKSGAFDLQVSLLGEVTTLSIQLGSHYHFDNLQSRDYVFLFENLSAAFLKASVKSLSVSSEIVIYSSNFQPLKYCNLGEKNYLDCFRLFKRRPYYFQVVDSNQSLLTFDFELSPLPRETLNLNTGVRGFLNKGELSVFSVHISDLAFYNFLASDSTELLYLAVYDSQYNMIGQSSCSAIELSYACNLQLDQGDYFLAVQPYFQKASTSYNLTYSKIER